MTTAGILALLLFAGVIVAGAFMWRARSRRALLAAILPGLQAAGARIDGTRALAGHEVWGVYRDRSFRIAWSEFRGDTSRVVRVQAPLLTKASRFRAAPREVAGVFPGSVLKMDDVDFQREYEVIAQDPPMARRALDARIQRRLLRARATLLGESGWLTLSEGLGDASLAETLEVLADSASASERPSA